MWEEEEESDEHDGQRNKEARKQVISLFDAHF